MPVDEILESRFPPSKACDCRECRSNCRRPGWMTVSEAKRLIMDGKIDRLMLDYTVAPGQRRVALLCPALKGHEGQAAPWEPVSDAGCTFWIKGRCAIHRTDYKPLECRNSHHANTPKGLVHYAMFLSWDTDEGRAVVALWHAEMQERSDE